ncbi:FG-GAP repeat domain-containing protein [Anthocerotibacter panamensis]|uniref:FG-GAP repeat domain-containing protein n=1 Tax=Anthocerotibacter panamensis TaxID=2857077 RepID=UPI001C4025B6|nr:VCBS repeat-containing protein [Anthocerotibacter panamensis]
MELKSCRVIIALLQKSVFALTTLIVFGSVTRQTVHAYPVNLESNEDIVANPFLYRSNDSVVRSLTTFVSRTGPTGFDAEPETVRIEYGVPPFVSPSGRGLRIYLFSTIRTNDSFPIPSFIRRKGTNNYIYEDFRNLSSNNSYTFRASYLPFFLFPQYLSTADNLVDQFYFDVSNGLWLSFNSSNQTCTSLFNYGAPQAPYYDTPVPGDYDQDALTDAAVWRRQTGEWFTRLASTGQSIYRGTYGSAYAPYNDVATAADYDGDGFTDISVWRTSTGEWLYRSTATGQDSNLGAFGIAAAPYYDLPVQADYDGDGKTDLAVRRRQSGNYQFIVRYSSNGQVKTYSELGTGSSYLPQGYPVHADYDGDGKVDPAVASLDASFKYVVTYQSSSIGQALTKSFQSAGTGVSASVGPRVGDFDGDGIADPAVFYPNSSYMHYLSSTTGKVVTYANNCGNVNTRGNFTYLGLNAALSPIIIDTAGDGFDLVAAADGVTFDFEGFGFATRSSWTKPFSNDAFLVLDRNGNGKIDNGGELFGNHTVQPATMDPNGFIALAEFDKPALGGNNDGLISSKDAVYSKLRLWFDISHDGKSQPAELQTLVSKGITALDLDYKESRREDQHSNQFKYRARVLDIKGVQAGRWAWDVFFSTDDRTD